MHPVNQDGGCAFREPGARLPTPTDRTAQGCRNLISSLNRLSLKARLFLLAVASVGLMLIYVAANGVVRQAAVDAEAEAEQATMTLIAANNVEKDLTSLLRDTYLMTALPTPDRVDAARGNLTDFEVSLSEAESTVTDDRYTDALVGIRNDYVELHELMTDRMSRIQNLDSAGMNDFIDRLAVFDENDKFRTIFDNTANHVDNRIRPRDQHECPGPLEGMTLQWYAQVAAGHNQLPTARHGAL